MELEAISKEEFLAWKKDKVTQNFFSQIVNQINQFNAVLVSGETLKEKPLVTTEYAIARIQVCSEILNMEYEEPAKSYEH